VEPQDEVASDFMRRKGYPDIKPYNVDKLEGQPCWYYLYDLPEGTLELEVSYDRETGWNPYVTTFNLVS